MGGYVTDTIIVPAIIGDKVAVDSAATSDYLGAAGTDGALRVAANVLTYTDGGNFVTLTLADHATARTAIGLGTGNSPQFTHLGLGAAADADLGVNHSEVLTDTDNTTKVGGYFAPQFTKTTADYTNIAAGVHGQGILDSTNDQDWTHGVGMRGVMGMVSTEASSTGTVLGAASLVADADIADAATVTNLYGLYVFTPIVAGTKVTNEYGIYVADQDSGLTLNYAIYTGTGLVRFGDDIVTDRWLEQDSNTFIGVGVVGAGNLVHTAGDEGYKNSAMGNTALRSNTKGYSNSAMGYQALYSNTEGFNNSVVGYQAGRFRADGTSPLQTPENSVYIGARSKSGSGNPEDAIDNEIVIGYDAIGNGAQTVTLGNTTVTDTYINRGFNLKKFHDTVTLDTGDAETAVGLTPSAVIVSAAIRVSTEIAGLDSADHHIQLGINGTSDKYIDVSQGAAATTISVNKKGNYAFDTTDGVEAAALVLTITGGGDTTPSSGAVEVEVIYFEAKDLDDVT